MKRHDDSISDRLRRMAATDELAVGRGRAEQIASRALARAAARPHRRARLVATIVSGSAFAIVSVTGIGAVADQAVPGDSLYPVDRAYEVISRAIGRDVDRTQETLEEALVLAQRGDRIAAVNHVNLELGAQSPVVAAADATQANDAASAAAAAPGAQPEAVATPSPASVEEALPAIQPEAAPAAGDAPPTVEAAEEGPATDPFVLALENALRASHAAADSQDESAALAADEAVQSVVKLAAGQLDAVEQIEQAAPGAVTVATTTTTTTMPEEALAAVEDTDADTEEATTTTTEDGQSGSSTTSVPSDSEIEPPGDGETAGDDSGGSQESAGGAGGAGEPGDGGEEPPGPIILPIP